MKKLTSYLLIVFALLALIQGQSWRDDPIRNGFNSFEGAQAPHMFSTVIWAENTDTVDGQYTTSIANNVIGATDQVYYAASLFELGFANLGADDQKYLQVEGLTVNAGRTSFTLKMGYHQKFLGSLGLTQYSKIGISVIIVGSSFQGESGYAESSYVYPRTGILRDVLYTNSDIPVAQFDFRTVTEKSPFDYLPGSAFSDKCGMIKATANSDRIIEVSGCGYFKFHTYVSGFTISSTRAGGAPQLNIGARISQDDATAAGAQVDDTDKPQTSGASTIFKSDADDTSVGLWINYLMSNNLNNGVTPGGYFDPAYNIMRIQLSFVFVGIRAFEDTFPFGSTPTLNYPTQHLYRQDDFVYYASIVHGMTNTPPNHNLVSEMYRGTAVASFISYDATAGDNGFGNAYCATQAVYFAHDTPVVEYTILNPDSPTQIQQSGSAADTSNFGCIFFRRRNVCDGDPTPLTPLPGAQGIDVAANFVVDPIAGALTTGVSGFQFDFTQNAPASLSKADIKIMYNRATTDAKAFRVSIEVTHNALPINVYGERLRLSGFGATFFDFQLADATPDYTRFGTGPATLQTLVYYVYSTDKTQNTLLLEYSSTNHAISSISVTVEKYEQLLNGIECVKDCPAIAAAAVTISSITEPLSCAYCRQADNLVPNPANGGCTCAPGFFSGSSGNCEACSTGIPLCGTCSSASVCTSCTSSAVSVLNSAGTIIDCTCSTGFYPSGGKCLACPFGCKECTSATSCSVCQDSTNTNGVITRTLPQCLCIAGYYQSGNFICDACSSRCLTCQNSASQCLTCNETANWIKKSTTCECKSGYYELNTGTSISCQKCDLSCLECAVSSLYCTSCSSADFRKLAGRTDGTKRCDCQEGYVELQGTCVDKTCKTVDPFCQTCAFNPVTLASDCLSCGGNRYVMNGECVCKPGFYQSGTGSTATCQRCAPGCINCVMSSGKLQCIDCAARASSNDDGSCSCPIGTVIVEASNSLFCRTCALNCASCSGTPEYCGSCVPGFSLNGNNQCVCPVGTYLAPTKINCVPCMANCKSCSRQASGAMTCNECYTNYVFNGVKCALSCPNGKYVSGSSCATCPKECTSCLSDEICVSCASAHYLFAGSCREKCPSGTVVVGKQCLACQSPCSTCTGTASSCDTCETGYLLFHGKCVEDCPASTYYAASSCLACSSRCLTCEGTSTNCVSCASTQYHYNNDCFNDCPAAIVNGKCTDICPDGKFYENSKCNDCDAKCMTCSGSATNCTVCADGYISYAGSCFQNCPKGTYKSGNTCIRCDVSCQECQQSSIKCTICNQGYVKQGSYCVESCQDGFYKDNLGRCAKCGEGCQKCTSLNSCSACFDSSLSPTNGKCVKSCPPGAINNGDKCICTFGVLHQNACVTNCPEGFFVLRSECVPCQFPCKGCSGSANYCLSCADGYNRVDNRCQRTNNCPYGQVEQGSGCVNYCPPGTYLHKQGCVFECPAGYPANGFGGCVESTNPSNCPIGKYKEGSSCVDYCSAGHYANNVNYVCEKCPNGCQLCLSSTLCFACEPSYIRENNVCVPRMTCPTGWIQFSGSCYERCPPGTYPIGQSCSTVCPAGTKFWNPYCYPTCPTAFHTEFACLNACPANYTAQGKLCKYNR